jgi:FKBP-type peptidyl-prolyl isomerase-like protein
LLRAARRANVKQTFILALEDSMRRPVKLAVVAFAALLAACASGGSAPLSRPIESIPFAASLNIDLAKMTKTPSGLYYRDLEEGTGATIRGKVDLKVHYTGWLTNGVKFDGNASDDPPLTVPFGRGRVLKGWDEGLLGMRVGGRRQLIVPPSLGYGSDKAGLIPPDATLVFDVRVLSMK